MCLTMNYVFECMATLIPERKIVKQRKNDDFLIVVGDSMELFYLNELAEDFLSRCNGTNSIQSIFEIWSHDYDVDEDILKTDIVELVRDLQWKKLIMMKEIINNETV